MSNYEETFEEETPSTSPNTSQVPTENSESGSSTGNDDGRSSGSLAGGADHNAASRSGGSAKSVSTRESADSTTTPETAALSSAKAKAALPAPIPVATALPVAVPTPLPQAISTLDGDAETDDEESSAEEEEEADEKALWRTNTDARTGKAYYYNTKTRETTWQVPAALAQKRESQVTALTRSADNTFVEANEVSQPFASSEEGSAGSRRRATETSEGAPSTSVSVLVGAAGERQRAANEAQKTDEFQRLTGYVAFGGSDSAPSSMAVGTTKSSFVAADTSSEVNEDVSPLTLGDLLGRRTARVALSAKADDATKKTSSRSESAGSQERFDTTQPQPMSCDPAKEKSSTPDEEDPSSIFSTISQHLKPSTTTADRAVGAITRQAAPSNAVAAAPSNDNHPPFTAVPSKDAAEAPLTATVEAPKVRITVPALPPPSFATHTTAAPAIGPATSAAGPNAFQYTYSSPVAENGALAPPPPLPPSSGMSGINRLAGTPPPPLDPKLAELREVSEAVERLVRAFATLRGHGTVHSGSDTSVQGNGRRLPSFSPSSTSAERLSSSVMHKAGCSPTVRTVSEGPFPATAVRKLPPPPKSRPLTGDEKTAVSANDALVEDVLLSCVLEMLQDDLGKARRTQRIVDRVKMAPQHVTVSADEFRCARGAGQRRSPQACAPALSDSGLATDLPQPPPLPQRTTSPGSGPFSVFDGELRAFDADGHGDNAESASVALYDSVQTNLQKYVISHVVDPTQPQQLNQWRPPAPSPGGGAVPTPVTPHFVWILLMDLLAVCTDVLERGFTGSVGNGAASIPSTPVIVRYDGERHCELLARNAIHCLPFEVLETAPPTEEDGGGGHAQHPPRRRPLFRMEFWVTRAAMFTVVDALTATIRQHIVHMANTAPYSIFATDINPYVNARVLAPSNVPMFSVVLDRQRQGRGASPAGVLLAGAHRERARAAARDGRGKSDDTGADTDEFFGVPPPCLQSLAYTVSTIATEQLQKHKLQKRKDAPLRQRETGSLVADPESYDELAQAVTETVSELLADAGIRAAVERRSSEKYELALKAKRDYPTKSRLERERVVVQRAEKEAEDLVRKIAQEMLIHEAGV